MVGRDRAVARLLTSVLLGAIALAVLRRRRHLGHRLAGRLGLRDHQLCLVDRDRQRRHVHLGAVLPDAVEWRNSINRFAESMTLFGAACAGIYPILHLGRPWFFYWLFPYPNTMHSLAAVPQPAAVGLLRDPDLCDRLGPVLVSRPAARPGDDARPGD